MFPTIWQNHPSSAHVVFFYLGNDVDILKAAQFAFVFCKYTINNKVIHVSLISTERDFACEKGDMFSVYRG